MTSVLVQFSSRREAPAVQDSRVQVRGESLCAQLPVSEVAHLQGGEVN